MVWGLGWEAEQVWVTGHAWVFQEPLGPRLTWQDWLNGLREDDVTAYDCS